MTCACGGSGRRRSRAPGRRCSPLPRGSGSRARRTRPGSGPRTRSRAESHREHDRPEAAQVQLLWGFAVERLRLGDLRPRQAALGDQLPDQIHELRIPLIAPGDALAEVRREPGAAAVSTQEAAEQGDAHLPQRPVVEVVAAPGPRRLHVGGQPSGGARQRAQRRVEEPRLERPPREVPVAEPAGEPRSPPTGQEDLTASLVSSSVIWQPDWPLPTTSTGPAGSSAGLR